MSAATHAFEREVDNYYAPTRCTCTAERACHACVSYTPARADLPVARPPVKKQRHGGRTPLPLPLRQERARGRAALWLRARGRLPQSADLHRAPAFPGLGLTLVLTLYGSVRALWQDLVAHGQCSETQYADALRARALTHKAHRQQTTRTRVQRNAQRRQDARTS